MSNSNSKMTEKVFLTNVASLLEEDTPEMEYIEARMQKIDEINRKRQVKKASDSEAKYEPIKQKIRSALSNATVPIITSSLAIAIGETTPVTSAVCRKMVDGGELSVTDVPVKGGGKKKGYMLKSASGDSGDTEEKVEGE